MKVVHSPSPSTNPKKREKINLFENDDPEEVAALCQQSAQQESNKILLRIDTRTQVLVDPKDATQEHAEKLRQRYKLDYHSKAVGDAKRLQLIIQQADKQLLSHPIEVLEKQLHSQLTELVSPIQNNKP